jgi:adenylate cyclase
MPREIERKFLVASDAWRVLAHRRQRMSQGYLASDERISVRVRVAGAESWLNIKSGGLVASRAEYEYPIPVVEAHELLRLAVGPIVDKTRHFVGNGDVEWEVDEFHGANSGLVVAEIELDTEDQEFPRPSWIGIEVTHLKRYYNVCLVNHPYAAWTDAERNP